MACVIGILTGGLGLAVYFRSIVDAFMPIALVVLLGGLLKDVGILGGLLVAGLYGYARALTSNEQLIARSTVSEHSETMSLARSKRRRAIRLKDLLAADMLAPESRLFAERGGSRYEAMVKADGVLELPDLGEAQSPSAAAELVRGRRTNGWEFWKVQTATGVVRLSALRDEFLKQTLKAGG